MSRNLWSLIINSLRIVAGWYIFFSYIFIPFNRVLRADQPALVWDYYDTRIIVGLLLFVILFGSRDQLIGGLKIYSHILNTKLTTNVYVGRAYHSIRVARILVIYFFIMIYTLFFLPFTFIYTLWLSVKKTIAFVISVVKYSRR